jgi:hypothetical protein
VLNFEWDDPMAADFQRLNVPVHCQDHQRLIFEDRLAVVLRGLSRFQPTVVLANLSATSFEVLRYLPAGVSQVGVGQSDHPTTYEMMRHYAPHMDLLPVVSETMKRKGRGDAGLFTPSRGLPPLRRSHSAGRASGRAPFHHPGRRGEHDDFPVRGHFQAPENIPPVRCRQTSLHFFTAQVVVVRVKNVAQANNSVAVRLHNQNRDCLVHCVAPDGT